MASDLNYGKLQTFGTTAELRDSKQCHFSLVFDHFTSHSSIYQYLSLLHKNADTAHHRIKNWLFTVFTGTILLQLVRIKFVQMVAKCTGLAIIAVGYLAKCYTFPKKSSFRKVAVKVFTSTAA